MGSNPKTNKSKNLTAAERADRVKEAKAREERAAKQREAAARTKKIFTVVVCVILILALCIPTMALTVLAG